MAMRNAKIDKNVDHLLEKVDALPEQIGEKIFQKLYQLMQSSQGYREPVAESTSNPPQKRLESAKYGQHSTTNSMQILLNNPTDIYVAEKLLDILYYDPAPTEKYLKLALDSGETLDEKGKARAVAMLESDKLKTWLAEDAFSSALLVNGRCDLEAAEGPSPLS